MRKSKQAIATILVLIILIAPTLYLGVQIFSILNRPYRTETAIEYDMSDSLFTDGYVVFDQVPVEGAGNLGYLVENGERVSAGTQVAEIYTDETQARNRELLNELNQQIELLRKSENISGTDVDMVLKQQQNALYDVLDQMDSQNYGQITDRANQYLLAANKVQIMTEMVSDFSQARAMLEEQKQAVETQLGHPETIAAPAGGYFTSSDTSDFLTYTKEQLDEMDPETLKNAIRENSGIEAMTGAGKIVTSYTWRFYGVCSLEESQKFENVTNVKISFPGKAEKVLPAVVESVTVDEEAKLAKVVIRCEYIGADVLTLCDAQAKIDFQSYEGIRINAKALHIVDGTKGVYVKYGNLARWRKIDIIYQNDEYLLVAEGGKIGTDNEVRLFDEVIVEGVDLKDGKILN